MCILPIAIAAHSVHIGCMETAQATTGETKMSHISHMPKEARAAYDAGDVGALRAAHKELAEFYRSIEDAKHLPYAESQRFSSVGDRREFYSRQKSSIFYGLISLTGGWEDWEAGRLDVKAVLGS